MDGILCIQVAADNTAYGHGFCRDVAPDSGVLTDGDVSGAFKVSLKVAVYMHVAIYLDVPVYGRTAADYIIYGRVFAIEQCH